MMADEETSYIQNTKFYQAFINNDYTEQDKEIAKYFKIIKAVPDSESGLITNHAFSGTFGNAFEYARDYFLVSGVVIQITPCEHGDLALMCIDVDINGIKKPNTYGRDVFILQIDKNSQIQPYDGGYGAEHKAYLNGPDGEYCRNEQDIKSGAGWCCAQRIIADGWKMNY